MPVRNGESRIPTALHSALTQSYREIEIIISDNESSDGTEELCRALAEAEPRVRYHRQKTNVGLFRNFIDVMRMAEGTYFCWLGDDDAMHPGFLDRSASALSERSDLVLATTGVSWAGPEGDTVVRPYDPASMQASTPLTRFCEVMAMLNRPPAIDPLASLMRLDAVAKIPRRNMMREDQFFATQLALAGPWAHEPEVLLTRTWKHETRPGLARHLEVPWWQGRFTTSFQTCQLWRLTSCAEFSATDRWRARRAVLGHHIGWHRRRVADHFARS